MKTKVQIVLIATCIFLIPGVAEASSSRILQSAEKKLMSRPFKVASITIPKSGSHLLAKCIYLMTIKDAANKPYPQPPRKGECAPKKCHNITKSAFIAKQKKGFIRRILQLLKKDHHKISFHLVHTPDYEKFIKRSSQSTLFLIRDPRDQLVSITKWACAQSKHGTPDFNKMLLNFIAGKQQENIHVVRMDRPSNFLWSFGIAEYYKLYVPWIGADNVYTVHFENLVGAEGGGTRQAQVQEILNIARHLNIKLTPDKINDICDNLFGGTNTFSKGQIGSWKEYFTPEHKQAFKKIAGQLLIDLGYEKDMNW